MSFLATTRSRRANAGANMSKLLDQEEAAAEDDFYKTHYGGFDEIENDSDFEDSDSSDSENVIDSDFDIDETQAVPEDETVQEKALEAEEREERRKKNIYKDPKANNAGSAPRGRPAGRKSKSQLLVPKSSSATATSSPARPPGRPRKRQMSTLRADTLKSIESDEDSQGFAGNRLKNLRRSTQKVSQETRDLMDERNRAKKKKRKFNKDEYRPLTQKQLLEEAKRTEIENLKSLEAYKNMEIEKVKRVKVKTVTPNVPMIRYHSYTEYDGDDEEKDGNNKGPNNNKATKEPKKYSRTIITFPSEESLRAHFPSWKPEQAQNLLESIQVRPSSSASNKKSKDDNDDEQPKCNGEAEKSDASAASQQQRIHERRMCPVTDLPAKYFDPLTQLPYANLTAFRFIRRAYLNYLQSFEHLRDDPRVKKFIAQNPPEQIRQVQAMTQFNVPVKKKIVIKAAPAATGGLTAHQMITVPTAARMGVKLATRPVVFTPGQHYSIGGTPTAIFTLPISIGTPTVGLATPMPISTVSTSNMIGTNTTSMMSFPTHFIQSGATLTPATSTGGGGGGSGTAIPKQLYYITQNASTPILIPASGGQAGQQFQVIHPTAAAAISSSSSIPTALATSASPLQIQQIQLASKPK